MRRPSTRKPAVTVALFPFLAVLVCTMGALIVLLVLMVQQARVYARGRQVQPAVDPQAARRETLEWEMDGLRWRREILEEQRLELRQKLADHRLQLSHLEDHIRRLEEKWRQAQQAAAALRSSTDATAPAPEAAELQALQSQLQRARQELADARKAAADRPPSFAVVPYDGPHGTQRRPIYIECTGHGIILQPEGIVLTADDFNGPLGPGNPLDAALRATREHLARLQLNQGEPYPLLIVRPDGAVAYNVAREAMNAWDDEFGYELVDADMRLQYPPADPALKELLVGTVRDARQRQAILAAAMPSQFQGEQLEGFVASPSRGGFVPLGDTAAPGSGGTGRGSGGSGQPAWSETPAAARGTAQARSASSPAAEAAGQAGGHGGMHKQPQGEASAAGMQGASLATMPQNRGKNWALPKSSPGATAITRPIGVACYADRIAILPEPGINAPPAVVHAPDGIPAAVDAFVSAVWKHMEAWGLALPGGYWKPVLQVYVAPDAEAAFAQLQTLLAGSGFEVQRKTQ